MKKKQNQSMKAKKEEQGSRMYGSISLKDGKAGP